MTNIQITDRAVAQIKELLAKHDKPQAGIRLGTRTYGCSGMGYTIDLCEEAGAEEELIETAGVKLYVEKASLPYIAGTVMDYEDTKFSTGFTFSNPNETGRCGCGESFTVG